MRQGCECAASELRVVPGQQLARKQGFHACNHKGLNSANNLNELGSETGGKGSGHTVKGMTQPLRI